MANVQPFTVHIKTYGCQMNERDSEMFAVLLGRQGYALCQQESQADLVIVNTCSVRTQAEDKAIGKLRMLIAARKERPQQYIGAVGCMVQRLKHELLRKAPGLDFAVGPAALARLPAVLDAVRAGRRGILEVDPSDSAYDGSTHAPGKISAFVNILFGCNRRCTFCVVPEVRGNEWSRPAQEVIEEAAKLVAQGVKEITLLGQSIMAYGRRTRVWDGAPPSPRGFSEPLPRLLEALNDLSGLQRLRFTSGHPSGCSPELARAFAELPAVCEHLHLPLQSAADRILKLMNRGYTLSDYRAAVQRLRQAAGRIVFSTDVIVGFPTETPEEFELTRAFLEEINFDNVYIFKYNPRPGTVAAAWSDDVSPEEKLRRNHVLLQDQERRSRVFHQTFIGRTCEVLVEGVSLRNEARWSGRTRDNILTVFAAQPGLKAGDLVPVRVTEATAQALYGTIESNALR
ncbi:MAG: tRNA (N6-isopentenyl adenosine(37)-C2)-methylthiotransferase MiaB [Lentisphaerae bacterium]|nr:tRNA (N6-isopentenyl adenosine(37)-C2)-methylthiotransferase MiaB [Lentisphaerota bacterium]